MIIIMSTLFTVQLVTRLDLLNFNHLFQQKTACYVPKKICIPNLKKEIPIFFTVSDSK